MNTKLISSSLTGAALLWIGLAPAALAGSRSSASYRVPADVTDAGGRRSASASYANDASVGGVVGVSTTAAPVRTLRHGYIPQISQVGSVSVSALPPTVSEGTTRQLGAVATLDDGSILTLLPAEVQWSVVSGPLNSISAGGLGTAGVVYQDTAAFFRGSYQGRAGTNSLTVLETNHDNFALYAGDGLPDDWQVLYFGVNNPNAAPGLDPDGDGQTTAFEYMATSNPADGNSMFRLRIERHPALVNRRRIIFSPYSPTRLYSVETNNLPRVGGFAPLVGGIISDNGSERTVTDPGATDPTRFYRVRISLAP